MKLQRIELMENSAAVRLFAGRVIRIGGDITVQDKRSKITDLDEDAGGSVWVNKGLYIISPASLAFRVPVEPEVEWARRFARSPDDGVAMVGATGDGKVMGAVEAIRQALDKPDGDGPWRCAQCTKVCASGAGLAAHVRSAHP